MTNEELVRALSKGIADIDQQQEAADRIEALKRDKKFILEERDHTFALMLARTKALTAEQDELQQVFDFQWRAHMRAVEMWRTANPGNDLVLPDSAKLTVWMLEQLKTLTAERDEHWKSFVHWRKEADALTEQLEAARADAKEAEAYAGELERDLKTCRMAQVVMDNTVAELEAKLSTCEEIGKAFEEDAGQLRNKLAKAVEALRGLMQHMPDYADTVWQDARATLAEIESSEAVTPYGLEGEKG